LLATSFLAITHPEDRHLHDDNTALLIAGTIRDYTLEKRYIRKDGEAVWVSITVSPLWKKGEVPGRNIAVVQDITEKKRAEAEIRKLTVGLERRVAERTAQLEVLNREMEAFSYSVSHDLRAPLRSIDGFSRALLEDYRDALDETGKSSLERLLRATRRMSTLIDEMLNLSRLTKTAICSERVDLTEAARRIVQYLRQSDPARSVDVDIQKGIVVWGDPHLLRVAMENLLANAWKFTGKNRHPHIEFSRVNGDAGNCCYLRDNGVGFDMAYSNKLFGAFQRLHRQDEFPGTGIGLATVQRIINRHGGRIWAEARPGEGATFFFVLPAPPGGTGPGPV
jgi:light-regulated signal transduction histidine kinase (bacteriophytochrome)